MTRRPRRRNPNRRLAAVAAAGALLLGSVAHASAAPGRCPAGTSFLAGAGQADITPRQWPVGEAAYGIGRLAGGAAHPFWARAVALRACADGATVVLVGLDSQGYFTAYKEDPTAALTDPAVGYGTTGIRLTAAALTGVPADNMLISATHTHNSPDSVGIWGGGGQPANKAPYLALVKAQTVRAIVAAVRALQPARLKVGTSDLTAFQGTYGQVSRDRASYPVDHTLRVLEALPVRGCRAIATLVNAGVHADVAGPLHGPGGLDLIDPDWPGRVATDVERRFGGTAVVLPGAVGRTGPSFPVGTDPHSKSDLIEVAAYGDALFRRVATALTVATPVAAGPVAVSDTRLPEEIAEPALIPLFFDESGVPGQNGPTLGGTMRSILPPYTDGPVLSAEAQTIRVGSLLLAGVPGEAYPELATELAARVRTGGAPPFLLALANDQLGYTPPAYEFPVVAAADGGDEGFFTINVHFGDDLINQHLKAARALGFTTQGSEPYTGYGKVIPDDQQSPAPDRALPEPRETTPARGC